VIKPTHTTGDTDFLVARLAPNGTDRIFVTYLGGWEEVNFWGGVAVDAVGNILITGRSGGAYPTTPGSFTNQGAVLSVLSSDGRRLRWSGHITSDNSDR
jgi:hypothetical protein